MVWLRGILGPAVMAATFAATTVAASAAPSVTATQTDTYAFASLSASTNLLFNGFDSSLGTLTGVFVTLTYSATVNDTAFVLSGGDTPVGSPTPLTATATTTLSGTGLLAGLSATGTVTTPGFVGTVADNGLVNTVGTQTATNLTSSTSLLNPPIDLSGFIGGLDSISLLLTESGTQGGSVPANVLTGNNGNANVSVALYYQYDAACGTAPGQTGVPCPVPEPASMSLLGAGLVALGTIVRRRRKI
jgi:hypothetical protein